VSNTKDFSQIKPALANGSNVKLQYALVGEPAQSTGRAESPGGNVQAAGLWSTAPYKDPKLKPKTPAKPKCKGKNGTCKAHMIKELGLCVFHARQAGVYDAWTEKEVASSTSQG
jgi:hypothetical protein